MLTSTAAVTLLTTSTPVAPLALVARALVPALVSYALRSTLVLLAAWIVALRLRRSAAATRHAVWAVALTTVAVLPLLSRATPPIDVPVRALASIALVVPAAPAQPVRSTIPASSARRSAAPVSHRAATATLPRIRQIPSPAEAIPTTLDLAVLIVAAWMLGTICLLIRSVVGTLVVWRRALTAESVSDSGWVMLARDVARDLGIRRPVTLLMTGVRTVPVTWGIVYPVVLLPVEAADWSPPRRRAVLLHELAHVARFDAATQLLGQLVLAATWFNPLTWLAVCQMRAERERACDDVVLRSGTQASTYATDLLTIVRTLQAPGEPGFAALAMARHAELEGRLLFILDAQRRRTAPSVRRSMLSLAAVAPFIVLVAAVHPSARAVPRVRVSDPVLHLVSSATPATSLPSQLSTSVAHAAVHAPHLVPTTPAPTSSTTSGGPVNVPVAVGAAASPTPTQSDGASTRCPVQTEVAHGGVSADRGQVASLELENDDQRVLVTASDGRCVSGTLEGWVILSDDETRVTGLGTGAHLTIADSVNGHVRRVVVSRVKVVLSGHDKQNLASKVLYAPSSANEPLYVIDGVIVEPVSGFSVAGEGRSPGLYPIDPGIIVDGQPQVSTSSGYPMLVTEISPADIEKLKTNDSSHVWVIRRDTASVTPGVNMNGAGTEPDSVGVEFNSVGGVIAYQYFVDGRPRSWTEGAEWFRTTLPELVRESGYNVQTRVTALRAGGGVPAVLGEIRQVRSDMGLRAYFDALLATGDLSPDDAAQALSVAQSMLTEASDRDRIVAQLKTQAGRSNRSTGVHVF